MDWVGKSKVVAQMGLVEKSNVVAQTGLEEETMDVGKRTSYLMEFCLNLLCFAGILMISSFCVDDLFFLLA